MSLWCTKEPTINRNTLWWMMGPLRILLTEQSRVPLQLEPVLAVVLDMGTDAELVAVAAAAFRAVVVAVGDVRRSSALLYGH